MKNISSVFHFQIKRSNTIKINVIHEAQQWVEKSSSRRPENVDLEIEVWASDSKFNILNENKHVRLVLYFLKY